MRSLICSILVLCSLNVTSQIAFENLQEAIIDGSPVYGVVTANGLGSGISFFDFDNDGWDDITLPASNNNDFQFFKNLGGTYESIDLPITSEGLQSRQAIWVDFDNDGDNDFFATSDLGTCWLYQNNGNNIFFDITESSGLAQEQVQYWGVSWGDYDNDGFLDVFLSVRDNAQIEHNELYRNNGDGTFTNTTIEAGLDQTGFITFCSSFFDYDNDGDQDLYMANDKCVTSNILYRNNGDGTFSDVSEEAGVNLYMSAMSTTIDDYDNDGWLDIYVTNFYPPFEDDVTIGNAFLKNNGDGTFTNIAEDNGSRFDSIGWGAVFVDADNDTDLDLYVSGSLNNMDPDGRLPAAFYEQQITENFIIPDNAGFLNDHKRSYSNAIGDVQNDGLVDMIVLNTNNEPIDLWVNQSETINNWLKVELEGVESNRMGIGSKIKVFVGEDIYYRYTLCGEGYIAQNSQREFFGLGGATLVDAVEVHWLSGQIDRIEDVEVNQTISIIEGQNPLKLEEFSSKEITITPNPASDQIKIGVLPYLNGGNLNIYDLQGRLMYNQDVVSDTMDLNVSFLAKGLYLVQLQNKSKEFTTKLIRR